MTGQTHTHAHTHTTIQLTKHPRERNFELLLTSASVSSYTATVEARLDHKSTDGLIGLQQKYVAHDRLPGKMPD